MLVKIEHVTVILQNPDDPADFDEFSVTGQLRIDDYLYPELDNDFAKGTPFASITGVLFFGFSQRKLLPRGPVDYPLLAAKN